MIEQSSKHGFASGNYVRSSEIVTKEKVYLDITEDTITVYELVENKVGEPQQTITLQHADTLIEKPITFHRTSLDIDITSILFKYRFPAHELPAQLATDLNVALYAGWRHDNFRISGNKDALGRNTNKIVTRGYDFGILAGTGSTVIGPATTKNQVANEYNGMILELGLAAFIETSFVSFGIATGFDHLLNDDRNNWIYNKKPWLGFVVGIALN